MKNDTKAISDSELLKKISEYVINYNLDFSNYYFRNKIWKKDYLALFGEIPAEYENDRKIGCFTQANTKIHVASLSAGDNIIETRQNSGYCYEIKYVNDLNCIAIINYNFNTEHCTIIKSGFFFIDSQKRLITIEKGEYKFVDNNLYAKTVEIICCGNCLQNDVQKMYSNAFKELFPICSSGGNNYFFIRNPWQLNALIARKEVTKRSGPKQNKIDKLCEISLPKAELVFKNRSSIKYWWEREGVTVVASRANEEYVVLRWFMKSPDTEEAFETARLFVSKKDVEFCRINSFGEFVYINGKLGCHNFSATNLIIENEDVFKGTKLEYFQACMDELEDDSSKIILLWLFSYYPIAEKMWKSPEYKHIPFKFVTDKAWGKFDENIKTEFGNFNANGKNIYRSLGINPYQAEYVAKHPVKGRYVGKKYPIAMMKNALNLDDISFMDNKTFENFMMFFQHAADVWRASDVVAKLNELYPIHITVRILNDFVKNIDRSDIALAIGFYHDYLEMASRLNSVEDFKPYFRSLKDICEMHNAAMAIYELMQNAIKKEAFDKYSSKWKKWEYNKNPLFIAIAPVEPNELAREGTELHHCVKSYIDKVADGRTNIMFIRKKSDPNTPFFTVEVGNGGTIEQVHGFGNRNAESEPKLEEFIAEWAEKCKLNIHHYNKIR